MLCMAMVLKAKNIVNIEIKYGKFQKGWKTAETLSEKGSDEIYITRKRKEN